MSKRVTTQKLLQLRSRMVKEATQRFHTDPEGIASIYVIRLLEGLHKKATVSQAYIDIVRLESGRKASYEAKVAHILELHESGRMVELVETYGQEFEANYTITDSFMVLSGCFNPRNPNQTNGWQFTNLEDALKKKFLLIYYRVYDHYVRNVQ